MMYLVCYSEGEYESYCVNPVFVTNDKSVAEAWCDKFNRMVGKWRQYYKQFEVDESGTGWGWLDTENYMDKFDRWIKLRDVDTAFIVEIEER